MTRARALGLRPIGGDGFGIAVKVCPRTESVAERM